MMRNWWEVEAADKKSRKKIQAQSERGINQGDSFLIVTEGTVTEPVYFKELRKQLRARGADIEVLPGKKSDPFKVIDHTVKLSEIKTQRAKQGRAIAYDHVWAVIDTDVAVINDDLQKIIHTADTKGVKLALSNPCFEAWLIFHVMKSCKPLISGKDAKSYCAKILSDSGLKIKNTDNEKELLRIIAPLVELHEVALQNASKHGALDRESPIDPSTDVYLLVQDIIYSLGGNSAE
ncbi:MAG: RloB family protein [Akkermansiaceae bacterium]